MLQTERHPVWKLNLPRDLTYPLIWLLVSHLAETENNDLDKNER